MKSAGDDVQGMFSNDIVGASQAFDGTRPDPFTVRLFVETIPTAVTANQIALMQATGGENDGMTHQLARFVTSVAHPRHVQGQRAVRRARRGPDRAPQPGRLPGGDEQLDRYPGGDGTRLARCRVLSSNRAARSTASAAASCAGPTRPATSRLSSVMTEMTATA